MTSHMNVENFYGVVAIKKNLLISIQTKFVTVRTTPVARIRQT